MDEIYHFGVHLIQQDFKIIDKKNPVIPANKMKVISGLLDYLNKKAGTSYTINNINNAKLILSRLKEGYTPDDIKYVIDNKVKDWKGTDMEIYIRPLTLFSRSKFENYINSVNKYPQSAMLLGIDLPKPDRQDMYQQQAQLYIQIDTLLIPKMFSKFKESITSYPSFISNDFEPLRKIAEFLLVQLKLSGNIVKNKDAIVSEWELLSIVISKNNFYKQKSLSVIANQIQEIYQIHKNGDTKSNISDKSKRSGLSGTAIIQPDRKANTAL